MFVVRAEASDLLPVLDDGGLTSVDAA